MQTEESSSMTLFPFIGEPEAEILFTAPVLPHSKNWNIQSIKMMICNYENTLYNRQVESFNLFNSLKVKSSNILIVMYDYPWERFLTPDQTHS